MNITRRHFLVGLAALPVGLALLKPTVLAAPVVEEFKKCVMLRGQLYATLKEAFERAKPGDTIYLLKDAVETLTIRTSGASIKGVTFDASS